ncbi:MAG: isoprenylcysteine carboxylmethyltransferase family protein, partial [Pseudomonadota bacterium]
MSTFKTVLSIVFPIVVIGAVIWRSDINGWSSIPWVILSFGVSVIRRPFEQENKSNVIVDTRSVSVERFLLVLVAVGAFFLPLLHLLTGIFSRFDYTLGTIPTIAGIVLFLSGLWFFWRSHVDLGRNWSVTVELREDHSLITQGVYKYIRHPMYSAIWLFQLAQPL